MLYGEETEMRKIVTLALLVGTTLTSACNTIHGAGKDVQSAGKAVSKTADKAK